jgi:hypothetical protein
VRVEDDKVAPCVEKAVRATRFKARTAAGEPPSAHDTCHVF